MFQYTFAALELADRKAREAELAHERHRLVALANQARPVRRSLVRRSAAQLVAMVSLTAAVVVRRLDECVADDLGRSLTPTE
jgi:hypothetical protein